MVVIRGEGPKGGPGMPEMLTPTSAIMGAGLGKVIDCYFLKTVPSALSSSSLNFELILIIDVCRRLLC